MNVKVRIDNQTYDVRIDDLNARPIQVTVNGRPMEVWPEEARAVASSAPQVETVVNSPSPVPAPAAPVISTPVPSKVPEAISDAPKIGAVKAPIPGVIISISVKEGDQVKKGQELCVLEAMKMKNSIRSNRDGVIGPINIKVGDHIQQSQVLVEYKD